MRGLMDSAHDMKLWMRELKEIQKKLSPKKIKGFSCSDLTGKPKSKKHSSLRWILYRFFIIVVVIFIIAVTCPWELFPCKIHFFSNICEIKYLNTQFTDVQFIDIQSVVLRVFLLLFICTLSIVLLIYLFNNIDSLSQFTEKIFSHGSVVSISLGILSLICLTRTPEKNSIFYYYHITLYIATVLYIPGFFIYKLSHISKNIIIDTFVGPEGTPTKESQAVTKIIAAELSRLRRLDNLTNNQRMPVRPILANYPATHPAKFQTKFDSILTEVELSGNLTIGTITIPMSIYNFFYRLFAGRRIIGSVSVVDNKTKVITAEITGRRVKMKSEESNQDAQLIWEVKSSKPFFKNNSYIVKDNLEEQTKELAGLIFSSINDIQFKSNKDAIQQFYYGVEDYKDALHQPFRRRQLLHDSEQHFRKAISSDDCCIDAYYNLGIVYLELSMCDQAEKFFNIALEKINPNIDSSYIYYALADSIFNPVKKNYAPAMRKFWRSEFKKPFRNLNDPETYKNAHPQHTITIQKTNKAKAFCDAIINQLNVNRKDVHCAEAYILRSTLSMYLGDEKEYISDCYKGFLTATYAFTENKTEPVKNALIDSMLNFALACARDAIKHCSDTKKDFTRLSEYKEHYKIISLAIDIAELIDKKNSEIYYMRGRLNYYFSFFEISMNAYRNASGLQPDNYNYLANYAASFINHIQEACNYNHNIEYFNTIMEKLFNCPSRIRHEVLESIAEIPYNTKCDNNKNSKENCGKINRYILQAKIMIIFSHKMDTIGFAACSMSIQADLNTQYKCFYESNIVDIFYTNEIEWNSKKNIDFICKHFSEGNEAYSQSIREICNQLASTVRDHKKILKETLKVFTCKYICGNSELLCSMGIDDTQKKIIQQVIEDWTPWFRAQAYATIGRDLLNDHNYSKAAHYFSRAIILLENYKPEEIDFQRLYSFLGYALSRIDSYNQLFFNKTFDTLEKGFQNDSLDPFAHFGKGMLHLKHNNIINAHESFLNALSLLPLPTWMPVNLWYVDVIEFHPPELFVYYGISSVKFAMLQGKKEDRLKVLDDSILALSYLLDVYLTSNKADTTTKKELIAKAYYWLGRAYFIHGEFEKALEQFRLCNVDQYNIKKVLPVYWSAKCFYRLKKIDTAIFEFSKLIDDDNDDHFATGKSLTENKKQLEDRFDSFGNSDEFIAHCHLYRACCFAGSGSAKKATDDIKESEKKIERALENCENSQAQALRARWNMEELSTRGILFFHENKFSEAIDCLKMSLTHTNNSDLIYHLVAALLYHYCTLKNDTESKICRETIAFVFKVAEEHCLEINSTDELALPIDIMEKIFKLPS